MSKTLVVVESPAKAKTIKKYLGAGYEVLASRPLRSLTFPRPINATLRALPALPLR